MAGKAIQRKPGVIKPWDRQDWHQQAVQWIKQAFMHLGNSPITNIERVRNSDISAILRIQTAQGVYYFKAVAHLPYFTNEPVVTQALAKRYPHLVPKPACIDPTRRWMLTAEFSPPLTDPERDEKALVQAVHAFAQMQLDSAGRINEFLRAGLWDYGLDWLPVQIETLVREDAVAAVLTPEEVSILCDHLPLLTELCSRLANSPIPQTIVHGDFHPNNIAQYKGQPRVFDWTDASISFPFFDMVELLRHREVQRLYDPLKAAYMVAWSGCAPQPEREVLWKTAEPLGFLFMALSYRRFWGDRLPLGEPIPYYLRQALGSIKRLLESSLG